MKVKICGITSQQDAAFAAREGADAIGLNFYTGSPRAIAPELASEIVQVLPTFVEPVGLFVNATAQEIRTIASQVGLHTVQLHGDESPELLAELPDFRLIRAFRLGNHGIETISKGIEQCRAVGRIPEGVLVDAHERGRYGGTGKTAPWRALAEGYDKNAWPPLILAGGLSPENVAEAIEQVGPWGVDVASGVESQTPGRKCPDRVAAFLSEAGAAFQRIRLQSHA